MANCGSVREKSDYLNMPDGRFEIYGYDGKRWLIDSIHESQAAALIRCEEIADDFRSGFEIIQVRDQQKFSGHAAVVHEQTCATGVAKPIRMQPVQEVSYCEQLIDYYAISARLVLSRLLRGFLDDERITALELMHDYTRLRRLMRDDRLYPMALSHVATLQAKTAGIPAHKRSTEIDAAIEKIIKRAKNNHAYAGLTEMLEREGISAAYAALPKDHSSARKRVDLAGAVARHLRAYTEWDDKLSALLDLAAHAHEGDSFAVIDEAAAEILDGQEAVGSLLGTIPELSDKLVARIELARGFWHGANDNASEVLNVSGQEKSQTAPSPVSYRLSHHLANETWTHVPAVLMRQVTKTLYGTTPLRRQRREEPEGFQDILKALASVGGLAGGSEMVDAVTRRARVVYGDAYENLPPKSAVEKVLGRLQPRSAQIGYLLALAASPFGRKYRSIMIESLTEALKGLSSRQDLLAEGRSESETKSMMRELYAHISALEAEM